jgi:hypothetical protein
MNAGTLIQENRMRRQKMEMEQKEAEAAKAKGDFTTALGYMKERDTPDSYKVLVLNQKVRPYLQSIGIDLPEMSKWEEGHNDLAKRAFGIIQSDEKAGANPLDTKVKLSMLLSEANEERQKPMKPLVDALDSKIDAQTKERVAATTAGRGAANLSFRKDQAVRDIVKNFNADPAVRKIEAISQTAKTVRSLVTSNNPVAMNMVPTMMVKLSGDVGNIPESAKADLGGDQSILSNAERIMQKKASGKPLTPTDVAYMSKIADMLEAGAKAQKETIARERAQQFSQSGIADEETLFGMLLPAGKVGPASPAPAGGGAGNATMRWNPATGKVEAVQ